MTDIGGSLAAIQFDLSWIGRHHVDADTPQGHVQAANRQCCSTRVGASPAHHDEPAARHTGPGPGSRH